MVQPAAWCASVDGVWSCGCDGEMPRHLQWPPARPLIAAARRARALPPPRHPNPCGMGLAASPQPIEKEHDAPRSCTIMVGWAPLGHAPVRLSSPQCGGLRRRPPPRRAGPVPASTVSAARGSAARGALETTCRRCGRSYVGHGGIVTAGQHAWRSPVTGLRHGGGCWADAARHTTAAPSYTYVAPASPKDWRVRWVVVATRGSLGVRWGMHQKLTMPGSRRPPAERCGAPRLARADDSALSAVSITTLRSVGRNRRSLTGTRRASDENESRRLSPSHLRGVAGPRVRDRRRVRAVIWTVPRCHAPPPQPPPRWVCVQRVIVTTRPSTYMLKPVLVRACFCQ